MRKRVIVEVPVYGRVALDPDEIAALSISPKFKLYPKVTLEEVQLQTQVMNAKIRWFRTGRDVDPKGEVIVEDEDFQEKTPEQVVQEENHREVYDPESKTLDFRKLRATGVKNNPRVHLPGDRPPRMNP